MVLTRRTLTIAAAIVAALLLWLLLDWLIVSDKEKITGAIRDLQAACAEADKQAVMEQVSSRYNDGEMNRARLEMLANVVFKTHGPVDSRVTINQLSISRERAVADLTAVMGARKDSPYPISGISQWQAEFRKEEDKVWRLISLKPTAIQRMEVSSWGEMLKVIPGGAGGAGGTDGM